MKTKILKWLGIEEIKEDLKKINKEIFPKEEKVSASSIYSSYISLAFGWCSSETLIERLEKLEERNQKLEEYLGVEFIKETKEIKKYKKLKVKKK